MDASTGQKLSEQQGWGRVEDLATGFMADILQNSYGMARYQVVERIDVNEFPAKVGGFRYTPRTYLDVLRGVSAPYMPQEVDYYAIINQFNLLSRVARDEIDEVWVFGFPHAGFYEFSHGRARCFLVQRPGAEKYRGIPTSLRHHGFLL